MSIQERILAKCEELGPQKAADFFKENVITIRAWQRGDGKKKPQLKHADLLLDEEWKERMNAGPEPESDELRTCKEFVNTITEQITALKPKVRAGEDASASDILQAVLDGKWSRKVVLLMPCHRDINPNVMFNVLALIRKCPWLGFQYKSNTIIQRARNLLAHDFLKSEAEWSLWMDSDMAIPCGDPGFLGIKMKGEKYLPPQNAGYMTPERLMSHGKDIVGGVYARRGFGDGLCIQAALHPQNDQDRELAKRLEQGPTNQLHPAGYCATGCLLVHRRVYEGIMKLRPDLAAKKEGEPFDFFGHQINVQGEDLAFCRLAADAGFQSFLDGGLFCAHLGTCAYWPGMT